MRRSYNPNVPDGRASGCLEVTRRLYRGITDIAKRLDDQKGCALTITDLFAPSGQVLRAKLKDYCERLIFKDPVGHARKTEELLWRKAFYDTVFTAKKLRKGNVWNETEKALLSTHLAVGVGFYHHLILRLQSEYSLDLAGVIDFAYPREKTTLAGQKPKSSQNKLPSDEIRQCAIRIIHRSLICLGDLARYDVDLEPNWDSTIATRYYKIAVSIDPSIGMPHNQLGTMAGNRNHGLDAVYHYMRCILCNEPFEGAEGNLKRTIAAHSLTGKETNPLEKCAAKLFSLLQLWESDSPNSEHINHDCQDLLMELEGFLVTGRTETGAAAAATSNILSEDSIDVYLENCKNEQSPRLSDEVMFKIVAICLMSIAKLTSKQSGEVQGAVAFTLTIVSQLVQITINRLQEAVMEIAMPNGVDANLQFFENLEQEDQVAKLNGDGKMYAVKSTRDDGGVDVNDNEEKVFENAETKSSNGLAAGQKKIRGDKSKSLLTKLRRPRKRLNSSDSDASDAEPPRAGSSSDDMNSDISETEEEEEEDALSNVASDDAISEDFSDDEKDSKTLNGNCDDEKNENEGNGSNNSAAENGQGNTDDSPAKLRKETGICSSDESNSNALTYMAQLKKQHLRPKQLLAIFEREGSLQAIKIAFDWLRGNPEIFRMLARSSSASLKRVVTLLNLVAVDADILFENWDCELQLTSSVAKLAKSAEIVPMPEDIDMRGLKMFDEAHSQLDWSLLRQTKMRRDEETLLRTVKLTNFGKYICSIADSGVKFDEDSDLFVTTEVKNSAGVAVAAAEDRESKTNGTDAAESERSKGKLMRHMGRLWLKAEVRALESRLRSRLISPYLVPDQEALAKHTPALKRLVYAKKFVVIIPSVVVSALDEMKRTSSKAREATRWLEGQLRKGSRFLRAQRPNERLPLPLIKGPKAKDKEAWLFFQIIECCHYLTQQTKVGLNGDKEPPVVTLLTGFSVEERKTSSFSTEGLAKTAGVNLEHIEAFHTKWKTSSKSHG